MTVGSGVGTMVGTGIAEPQAEAKRSKTTKENSDFVFMKTLPERQMPCCLSRAP
jgi:hypothetical protein